MFIVLYRGGTKQLPMKTQPLLNPTHILTASPAVFCSDRVYIMHTPTQDTTVYCTYTSTAVSGPTFLMASRSLMLLRLRICWASCSGMPVRLVDRAALDPLLPASSATLLAATVAGEGEEAMTKRKEGGGKVRERESRGKIRARF